MGDIVEELVLLQSGAQWACGATAETLGHAADEIRRLRADLLKAEMQAEIAGLENITRAVAIGRREGIEAAIVACGAVSAETEGVWANGFTRGVIEAQASIRALLTERER